MFSRRSQGTYGSKGEEINMVYCKGSSQYNKISPKGLWGLI